MLFAVLDLGSNSFKMTVAQYVGAKRKVPFKIVHKERHPVQMGASVFESRQISPRHKAMALKALKAMRDNLARFNLPLVRIVGTSALRDAKNGKHFVEEISKKLGLSVEVISGLEEARVIAQGLEWEYPFVKRGVLVDIGGGSTEVAPFGRGWSRAQPDSFQMGSVRLALEWDRVRTRKGAEQKLRERIRTVLKHKKAPRDFEYLVGSAGAIQSLGGILAARKKNAVIHKVDLDDWIEHSFCEDPKSLQNAYGLAPSRARVLVPGAVILSETLNWLREEDIFVTEMTLRNGLLVDFVEKLKGRNWLVEL
jgi:exopolyphosphatase/guanosine-5'-triphosphate,3'-diphosphate pyrophosphatase